MPQDCSDCVFISGLPRSIEKQDIINFFTQAGQILVTKGTLSPGNHAQNTKYREIV